MCLCNSKTDSIRKSLSEWTSGDFNAIRVIRLWMAGGQRVDLAEVFKVFDSEPVPKEDEQNVLKSATVGMVNLARSIMMGKTYA